MAEEQTFLNAIRQEPDEPVHRQAFADLLEDRDDQRAELLRLHLNLDEVPEHLRNISELKFEIHSWWGKHARCWLDTLTEKDGIEWHFPRGLPEKALFGNYTTFKKHSSASLNTSALHQLEFQAIAGCKILAKQAAMKNFTELNLKNHELEDENVAHLLRSETLQSIQSLNLAGNKLSAGLMQTWAREKSFPSLRHLDLSNNLIRSDGLIQLLDHSMPLTSLVLKRMELSKRGAHALVSSETVRDLTSLNLNNNWIGDDAVAALSQSSSLSSLNQLRLFRCNMETPGMLFLCQSSNLANLRWLDFRDNPVGEKGIAALTDAIFLPKFERFDLDVSRLDGATFQSWNGACFPSLNYLSTGLTFETVAQLEQLLSARLPNLQYLSLGVLMSDGESPATMLANVSTAPELARLDLHSTALSPKGARALMHAPWMGAIRHLKLSTCSIGKHGVKLLAEAENLTRLRTLELMSDRTITVQAARDILSGEHLPSLRQLSLRGCPVGDEGLRLISKAPLLSQLTDLDLGTAGLSRRGLVEFLNSAQLRDGFRLWAYDPWWTPESIDSLTQHFGERIQFATRGFSRK